jgi:hypothetical protein
MAFGNYFFNPVINNLVPAQPAAAAQQAAQSVATCTSIVRKLKELTNLRNLYLDLGMEEFLPTRWDLILIVLSPSSKTSCHHRPAFS